MLADQQGDGKALEDRIYIGAATLDGIMRQWHMNVARPMHYRMDRSPA